MQCDGRYILDASKVARDIVMSNLRNIQPARLIYGARAEVVHSFFFFSAAHDKAETGSMVEPLFTFSFFF